MLSGCLGRHDWSVQIEFVATVARRWECWSDAHALVLKLRCRLA
jgi:hypothetical protein